MPDLKFLDKSQLVYWGDGTNGPPQFFWVGSEELDGLDVSGGVIDEIKKRYHFIYEDLGFYDLFGEGPYYSKNVDAMKFSGIKANFVTFFPNWEKDPDLKRFHDFLQICEKWCLKYHGSVNLEID